MIDRHEHLDEGTIHAWLDEALPPDESARVESVVESCSECAARVAEARGLIAASSRILSSLDAVPAGVVPGSSANVDQLAALRARRRSISRHWWQDRRVMVAASLVFVAGVSSLVLRSTPDEVIAPTSRVAVDSAAPSPEQAPAVVTTPPSVTPAPAATRETARDAQSQSAAPERDMTRSRVATAPTTDSLSVRKSVSEPAAPPVAANEERSDVVTVRRAAADSVANAARDRVATSERAMRQEGTRQTFPQLRMDSVQRVAAAPSAAAAPPAPAPMGARLTRGSVTGGAGAAMTDAAGPGGTCYRLLGLTAPAVADTIRLLNEMAPVLGDPSWFRTQLYGALRDTTFAWRSIDSVTVEVRARFGSDTTAVRFRTDNVGADSRSVSGIRSASAVRIACPR